MRDPVNETTELGVYIFGSLIEKYYTEFGVIYNKSTSCFFKGHCKKHIDLDVYGLI